MTKKAQHGRAWGNLTKLGKGHAYKEHPKRMTNCCQFLFNPAAYPQPPSWIHRRGRSSSVSLGSAIDQNAGSK